MNDTDNGIISVPHQIEIMEYVKYMKVGLVLYHTVQEIVMDFEHNETPFQIIDQEDGIIMDTRLINFVTQERLYPQAIQVGQILL
jgi:hypothetical protein